MTVNPYHIDARRYVNDFGERRATVEVWRGCRCLVEVRHESVADALEEARALLRGMRKAGRLK